MLTIGRLSFTLALLVVLLSTNIHAASPLLTVRSSASATLGEGTKAQVYEKAKSLAMRKAIEEHVGSDSKMPPSPRMGMNPRFHGGPGGAAGDTKVELGLEVEPELWRDVEVAA